VGCGTAAKAETFPVTAEKSLFSRFLVDEIDYK
jgi:hypothetical protein